MFAQLYMHVHIIFTCMYIQDYAQNKAFTVSKKMQVRKLKTSVVVSGENESIGEIPDRQ